MRKVAFTISLTLIFISIGLTQETQAKKECQNLAGTLRDMNTDEVIPFAKIVIYTKGKLAASINTDVHGNYTFENLNIGKYQLEVSIYETKIGNSIEFEIKDCATKYLDIDIENIFNLEIVEFIAYSTPNIKVNICTQGTCHGADCFCGTKTIVTRHRPAPTEKDPDKPIKELSIYPNPSFGNINIELSFETLRVRLFDMLGHNLGEVPYLLLEDEKLSIDLSNLPASTYILQLEHEEGVDTQKLIILSN